MPLLRTRSGCPRIVADEEVGAIEKSVPVPESATVCGLPGASSLIVRVPLALPWVWFDFAGQAT